MFEPTNIADPIQEFTLWRAFAKRVIARRQLRCGSLRKSHSISSVPSFPDQYADLNYCKCFIVSQKASQFLFQVNRNTRRFRRVNIR